MRAAKPNCRQRTTSYRAVGARLAENFRVGTTRPARQRVFDVGIWNDPHARVDDAKRDE